ncbi:hypothetical protein ACPTGM_28610 [Pseudomonas aeruginosa]|jgi:hypothetical protein|uniref:hypothetical protein n=2 Tax=Pseudomonas aeruginosa TaxID=287 RepID=UPI001DEE460A|nr:hypothetical protein [Pseudomonas aeruginosa]ELQ7976680.1 hypothetical protein [Pseudomonas aeruginosa]MBN5490360.1 hypothetical protein [Pseudomonas aeruginosa]MCV0124546.1 hypothetical protein [Pseudomonas aeruginosa]MDC3870195.1 hypothetical protein [Pseudomonas aeruginosa]
MTSTLDLQRLPRMITSVAALCSPAKSGTDDPHARSPRNVGDHMVQLHIHLSECLLHVLDTHSRAKGNDCEGVTKS